MINVRFEHANLSPEAPVVVKGTRENVKVLLHKGTFRPEAVAALNSAAMQFLAGVDNDSSRGAAR